MPNFSTGVSALSTSQRALEIIGQNIANANTPGYHRQVVNLASRLPSDEGGFWIGSGVEINDIRRLRDSLLETAVTRHTSDQADTATQLDTLRQIESLFSTGDGSIHDRLEKFFNQIEQLSARPDDAAQRRIVLGTAAALVREFNGLDASFNQMRQGLDGQIGDVVGEINRIAGQIAQLNEQIQRAELRGVTANDFRDQRDQLINELAERVGLQTQEQPGGQTALLVAGIPLVVGKQHFELETTFDVAGQAAVTIAGEKNPLPISGGKLAGLLQLRNTNVPDYQKRLDALARELMRSLDGLHATGLGLTGPMNFLAGHRSVSDVSVPLAAAQTAFPIQAGSVFISVTEFATGKRTLSEVVIDPAKQSLNDIAAAISGVAHIQAIADSQTGRLTIMAQPGYAFDFAGRLQSTPEASAITGTTVPQIAGTYSGTKNDEFSFRVVGSGTIGVTPNLGLEVRNSSGTVLASLNIGQGYEPSSALQVADGVTVRLSAGTANDGDAFSTTVVAEPDTAGILAALGLNTLFAGRGPDDIRVQPELLDQPELLAASRTGQTGDGLNLRRIASLRDQPLLANGTQNFRQFYADLVTDAGAQVQNLTEQQNHQDLLGQQLEAQRQSVSGVDPNEELVHMVQFQRSFQMAARYVTAVNETLDALFKII